MRMVVLHVCDVSQGAYEIVFGSIEKIVIVSKDNQRRDRGRENLISEKKISFHMLHWFGKYGKLQFDVTLINPFTEYD